MDKQEFMDIMVVAQTTPGIFAIDMASHIGYKLKGVWGGIVGAIGIALPSIIAILIIAMFFQQFQGQLLGGQVLCGCSSCRGSADCCSLLQDGKDGKHQPLQHLDSRCLLSADCCIRHLPYLHHHRSRCAGLALWKGKKSKKVKNIEKMLFLKLFLIFTKIGTFNFGGGYAMLSLIHNETVVKNHWLTNAEFTDIVAISQSTRDLSASTVPPTWVIPPVFMPVILPGQPV